MNTDPQKKVLQAAKVLVVDDIPDNQLLMRIYLESVGAKVDLAGNGQEAITKALSQDYDVVLMDIQMPEMDGVQATRQLRSQGYKKPILALTAHTLREEIKRSEDAGCDGHLIKPVSKQDLIRVIGQYLPSVLF